MSDRKIRLVYLAGPVDFDPTNNKHVWRDQAAKLLAEHNICSYLPPAAFHWTGGQQGADKLISINMEALAQSDAVLLHLNDHFTIGSFRELQRAVDLRKPVVLWLTQEAFGRFGQSLYLTGFRQCSSMSTAVEILATADPNQLIVTV